MGKNGKIQLDEGGFTTPKNIDESFEKCRKTPAE
jgi:hypothetical protein